MHAFILMGLCAVDPLWNMQSRVSSSFYIRLSYRGVGCMGELRDPQMFFFCADAAKVVGVWMPPDFPIELIHWEINSLIFFIISTKKVKFLWLLAGLCKQLWELIFLKLSGRMWHGPRKNQFHFAWNPTKMWIQEMFISLSLTLQ